MQLALEPRVLLGESARLHFQLVVIFLDVNQLSLQPASAANHHLELYRAAATCGSGGGAVLAGRHGVDETQQHQTEWGDQDNQETRGTDPTHCLATLGSGVETGKWIGGQRTPAPEA